nr:hypothetical protein [uncultured Actinoplanes sp.]
MTGEKPDSPVTLRTAVGLLYLEAAGMVALTVALIVEVARSRTSVAVGLAVMAALAAVAVFFVARSLGQLRRGSRGPAVVVQLFVIASGGFLVQTGPLWLGIVLIVLGAIIGVLVVLPSSTRALGIG